MVQERLELEASQGSRSGSVHASFIASSRRRKGGVIFRYSSTVVQRRMQDQHFYPQNTTNYHQGSLSWCVTFYYPCSTCTDQQRRPSNVARHQYRRWTFLSPMALSSQHRTTTLTHAFGIFSLARKLAACAGTQAQSKHYK